MIVIIAIDRLLGVILKFGVTRQRRRYRLMMVIIPWMFAFLVTIPTIKWTRVIAICGLPICTPDLRGVREVRLVKHTFVDYLYVLLINVESERYVLLSIHLQDSTTVIHVQSIIRVKKHTETC